MALLFGAIGGMLLIMLDNLFEPGMLKVLMTYLMVISSSVYILNRMRYKKEIGGSIIYGYIVYAVMTLIGFIDLKMNTRSDISNPLFDHAGFFMLIFFGVLGVSLAVVMLFRKKVIS